MREEGELAAQHVGQLLSLVIGAPVMGRGAHLVRVVLLEELAVLVTAAGGTCHVLEHRKDGSHLALGTLAAKEEDCLDEWH